MPVQPASRPAVGQPGPAAPPRPGLRELKRERVRRQLEDVAMRMFAERGFDATTVEEIAAAADVSPRTFFRYFATKEDVLLVVMDEVQQEILACVRDAYDGSADSLLGALRDFSHGLDRRRSDLLRASALLGQPSLYPGRLRHSRALEDQLAAVLASHHGNRRPTTRQRALASLAASAMSISMRVWLDAGARSRFATVFSSTLEVMGVLGAAAAATDPRGNPSATT